MNTTFDSQHSSLGDYGQDMLEANPFADDTAQVSTAVFDPVLDDDEVVESPISNVNKQLDSIDLNSSTQDMPEQQNEQEQQQQQQQQYEQEHEIEHHPQEEPHSEYTSSSQHEETDTQVWTCSRVVHQSLNSLAFFFSQNLCKYQKAALDLISKLLLRILKKWVMPSMPILSTKWEQRQVYVSCAGNKGINTATDKFSLVSLVRICGSKTLQRLFMALQPTYTG